MLYVKLNVTIQGSSVLHIDTHLPGILAALLFEASWLPHKKVAQFCLTQGVRSAYLAISSLCLFLSFPPTFGICPLSRWVKNLWQLQVLLPSGSPLQPLGDKTPFFSLCCCSSRMVLCVHLLQKIVNSFKKSLLSSRISHTVCAPKMWVGWTGWHKNKVNARSSWRWLKIPPLQGVD